MKSLIVKILPITLFMELVPAFRQPPVSCDFNSNLKAILIRKPAMDVHYREFTKESEGKLAQIFDVAFGMIFGIIIWNYLLCIITFLFNKEG
jgi:hypothetical protein